MGSFVGSRRVCFVDTRLCEWKGRKRMRKHSNPEKQFKTVFHHLDIQHNRHAVLFTAKIFIFESIQQFSTIRETLYSTNLCTKISTRIYFKHFFENQYFEYFQIFRIRNRLDLDFFLAETNYV